MAHKPLLTCSCDACFHAFASTCETARFCCDDCRQTHWRKVRKRFALVELFMRVFRLSESARMWVQIAVLNAEDKCYALAERLGYRYRPKKYLWVNAAAGSLSMNIGAVSLSSSV